MNLSKLEKDLKTTKTLLKETDLIISGDLTILLNILKKTPEELSDMILDIAINDSQNFEENSENDDVIMRKHNITNKLYLLGIRNTKYYNLIYTKLVKNEYINKKMAKTLQKLNEVIDVERNVNAIKLMLEMGGLIKDKKSKTGVEINNNINLQENKKRTITPVLDMINNLNANN